MGTSTKAMEINIQHQFLLMKEELFMNKKIYEELYNKIRDLIRSITNNSNNYVEKYMRIKFNSDDNLPLKKTLKLHNIVIVVRYVFHDG